MIIMRSLRDFFVDAQNKETKHKIDNNNMTRTLQELGSRVQSIRIMSCASRWPNQACIGSLRKATCGLHKIVTPQKFKGRGSTKRNGMGFSKLCGVS